METKEEKIRFVTALSNRIRDEVIRQIESGKVLPEWDGHELRILLAMHHTESAGMSKQTLKGKRMKEFKNHVIIANL